MMDNLKFALFSVVVLVLLSLLGYWAVATIHSGSEFATKQKLAEAQKENSDLTKQVADLTDQLNTLEARSVANTATVNQPVATPDATTAQTTPTTTTKPTTQPTTYKNQTLINALGKLVSGNVFMKLNSSGTRVGTVQSFLNIYNKTSNKIDNDYGASMVKAVTAFQKDQGLTADGQAGPSTYNKMIAWLKKQG
jgi:murein L,D-transpeptidase YcbB/YkuD